MVKYAKIHWNDDLNPHRKDLFPADCWSLDDGPGDDNESNDSQLKEEPPKTAGRTNSADHNTKRTRINRKNAA